MSPAAASIDLGPVRGAGFAAPLAFMYSAFTTAPPPEWWARYRQEPAAAQAALLAHTLDGNLTVLVDGQAGIAEEYFPLFRLAVLLTRWLTAPAAPGQEMRLTLDEYEHRAALALECQQDSVVLRWPVPTHWWPAETALTRHVISVLTVPAPVFTAASAAFVRQLQADVAAQFGIDIGELLAAEQT